MRRCSLFLYFVLACAFSWLIELPLAARARGWIGWSVPFSLHYLAAYGPLLSALVTVRLTEGGGRVRELLGGLSPRRTSGSWLMVGLLSPLGLLLVASAFAAATGEGWPRLWAFGRVNFLPDLGIVAWPFWLLTFGIGEELGWRGYALPRLQTRYSALSATLLLTLGWALWHLPTFLYLPSYRGMSVAMIPGFVFGLAAGAVVLTWLFNSSHGSILTVALWHGTFNLVSAARAAAGTVAAVESVLVMIWAIVVIVLYGPKRLSAAAKVLAEQGDVVASC